MLRPNKDAAAIIRTFGLAVEGEPLNAIRRYLEAETGWKVSRQGLHKLLTNIVYTGKVKCAGEVFDGRHEPLVDDFKFERVKRRLDEAKTGPKKRRPRKYTLAGLARCETCG